jgi:hypothetical protein
VLSTTYINLLLKSAQTITGRRSLSQIFLTYNTYRARTRSNTLEFCFHITMALKPGVSREKIESPALSYTLTVRFLSVILNLYYRRIETWGAENIPKQGPTIFVAAPHCNQVL